MGEKDIGIEDVFCQWARIECNLDPADCGTPVEIRVGTGLALFGDRAWAIHAIEFDARSILNDLCMEMGDTSASYKLRMGVGKPGLTDTRLVADGMIAHHGWSIGHTVITDGVSTVVVPNLHMWIPPTPVPYARNDISAYVNLMGTSLTHLLGAPLEVRVWYTYIPTTPELYRELAERWAL